MTLHSLTIITVKSISIGWEYIRYLTNLKNLIILHCDVGEMLFSIIKALPPLDSIKLSHVHNVVKLPYFKLFRDRDDKNIEIVIPTYKVIDDLLPRDDIVFKHRTTDLNLIACMDTNVTQLERQRDHLLAMLTCNTVIGNSLSTSYPYSYLLNLALGALPIDSDNLEILKAACPKLQTLKLTGIEKWEGKELFQHFSMVSFPLNWPSMKKVVLQHAYTGLGCLYQIVECSQWMKEIFVLVNVKDAAIVKEEWKQAGRDIRSRPRVIKLSIKSKLTD